jgi:hypothetical protein
MTSGISPAITAGFRNPFPESLGSGIIPGSCQDDIRGYQTDYLRVICDRKHPVWLNHGEHNGGIYNMPVGILNNMISS